MCARPDKFFLPVIYLAEDVASWGLASKLIPVTCGFCVSKGKTLTVQQEASRHVLLFTAEVDTEEGNQPQHSLLWQITSQIPDL